MTVGLRIFNNDGIRQISDSAHNLVLIGKGSFLYGIPPNPGQITYFPRMLIDFVHDGPVLFAASAPSGATAIVTDKIGTTYKVTILFGNIWETVTWYAFSYPKNIQTTMGLRVFNGAGSLVYDAAQKPLRMAHYSHIGTPGIPWIPSNPNSIPEWPPVPPDIYIPQQRTNRTYASLGIHMIPYRRVAKRWLKPPGAWLLGWASIICQLPMLTGYGYRRGR